MKINKVKEITSYRLFNLLCKIIEGECESVTLSKLIASEEVISITIIIKE